MKLAIIPIYRVLGSYEIIFTKHLVQCQDQSKHSETYRNTGHNLVLEPKDRKEKMNENNKIPQMRQTWPPVGMHDLANALGYFSVEAEVEFIKVRSLSNN